MRIQRSLTGGNGLCSSICWCILFQEVQHEKTHSFSRCLLFAAHASVIGICGTRTYYATHPDANTPLINDGYEQSVEEMEKRRDELKKSLSNAEGIERSDMMELLTEVETWLSNQEKNKWMISENAIAQYRSFAPSISFYENNPYITPDGSMMLKQLESLYQRYANGLTSLDGFLKELDEKMCILYLEGK